MKVDQIRMFNPSTPTPNKQTKNNSTKPQPQTELYTNPADSVSFGSSGFHKNVRNTLLGLATVFIGFFAHEGCETNRLVSYLQKGLAKATAKADKATNGLDSLNNLYTKLQDYTTALFAENTKLKRQLAEKASAEGVEKPRGGQDTGMKIKPDTSELSLVANDSTKLATKELPKLFEIKNDRLYMNIDISQIVTEDKKTWTPIKSKFPVIVYTTEDKQHHIIETHLQVPMVSDSGDTTTLELTKKLDISESVNNCKEFERLFSNKKSYEIRDKYNTNSSHNNVILLQNEKFYNSTIYNLDGQKLLPLSESTQMKTRFYIPTACK